MTARSRWSRHLVTLAAFSASLGAQTFVVDAANGPGANFTQIGVAIAAVSDGATLLVRPGSYSSFVVDGKGVTILAQGAQLVTPVGPFSPEPYAVRNTSATQAVVLRGLQFAVPEARLVLADCRGPLVVESVDVLPAGVSNSGLRFGWLDISRCDQVLLRDVATQQTSVTASSCAMERCTTLAPNGFCFMGICSTSEAALVIDGSQVQIAAGVLRGGSGGVFPSQSFANREAVHMRGSSLRLLGATTIEAGSSAAVAAVPAIRGTGSVRVDAGVVVLSNAATAIEPAAVFAAMPFVTSQSTSPGGVIQAAAGAAAGAPLVLVFGLPAPATVLPGVVDPLWIDPALHVFAAVGAAPLSASVNVPGNQGLLGFRLAWHAVQLGATLEASNPSWSLVR